ncbi:1711_t:CDS:2, partial [Ambispora leptoticha]
GYRARQGMSGSDNNYCSNLGCCPLVALSYGSNKRRGGSSSTCGDYSTGPFGLPKTLQKRALEIESGANRLVQECLVRAECLIKNSGKFTSRTNSSSLPASSSTVLAFVAWMEMLGRVSELMENAVQFAVNGLRRCAAQFSEA